MAKMLEILTMDELITGLGDIRSTAPSAAAAERNWAGTKWKGQ